MSVADDSGGAEFADGDILHCARLRGDEDDLSFYVLAGVVGFFGAVADVDESGGDVGAFAVFGERYRLGFVAEILVVG